MAEHCLLSSFWIERLAVLVKVVRIGRGMAGEISASTSRTEPHRVYRAFEIGDAHCERPPKLHRIHWC